MSFSWRGSQRMGWGLLGGLALLLLWNPTVMAADKPAPKSLIETYHASIKSILTGSSDVAKVRAAITSEMQDLVDFEAFSRLALKKYYDGLKAKERKQYIASFRGLVEATYVKRIKPGGKHTMSFRGEPEEIKGKVMISTTVETERTEVDIDYLFHKDVNGAWKIYDIWIDEVSMARNYRSQFYRIYKAGGMRGKEGLLEHMNRRQAEQGK